MTGPPEGSVPPVPDGSPSYYAVLFCPGPDRPGLTGLLALERELEQITVADAEPSIALLRLNWWDEEIQRLASDEPRHPITQTLQTTATAIPDVQALRDMVQISRRMISEPDQCANDALELDCQRSSALYGCAAGWLAASAGRQPPRVQASGRQLGAGIRLGRLATTDAITKDRELSSLAINALRQGLVAMPVDSRPCEVPLIVLATLHLRRLTQPAAPHTATSRYRRAVSSLGMIAAAWRAARAASRGRVPLIARSRNYEG